MRITIPVAKVLAALLAEPDEQRYGLDLMRLTGLPSGTLYPVLHRLQGAGWLAADWEAIDPVAAGRPARRYYRLTAVGRYAGPPGARRPAGRDPRRPSLVGRRRAHRGTGVVTRRVAELLLELAARRWPAEVRDDLRREWAAELHVLAESGRWTKMVGFAASLAVSRAGAPLVDRTVMRGRAGRTAAALLLSPIACVGIVALGVLALFPSTRSGAGELVGAGAEADLDGVHRRVGGAAGGVRRPLGPAHRTRRPAAYRARRGAPGRCGRDPVRVRRQLQVLVNADLADAVPGLLLWLAGLTLTLWAAASLAARGRVRAAWWVGVLGALVAADLAVILVIVDATPPDSAPARRSRHGSASTAISAPLWLFACWTDWNFGLPRPIDWEIFLITNRVSIEPMLYLACTPYALAYTIRAARSAPTAPVALVQTRSATGWSYKASGKPHRGTRSANG